MSQRVERVAGALKEELAQLIRAEVRDPRVAAAGLITITHVRVTPDLRRAEVQVSFTGGDDASGEAAIEVLGKLQGWLRGELARRLHLKHAPELVFGRDTSSAFVQFLENVVKEDKERG